MDDLDFADMLYQGWARTTNAESAFWGFDEEAVVTDQEYALFAMGEDGKRKHLGLVWNENDAAFITAVHGCFGDLIKRWHDALEEAERMEIERDNVVAELGQAYLEIDQLKAGRA